MECRVRDVSVYYEEVGTGTPVLMLHGMGADHHHMMTDFEPRFQGREGWRRLYPDLPGMGETRGAAWITSQDAMLEVVLGFLDVVAPRERFVVCSASYGSYLARGVVYRRRADIDGLLLIVPLVEVNEANQHYPKHMVLRQDPDFLAALEPDEEGLRDILVVQTREVLGAFRSAFKGTLPADTEFLKPVRANPAFSFPVDTLTEPLFAPTLIITGRQDNICGYREAWQLLDNYPRATLAVLDGGGHGVGAEQPIVYNALVSEWFNRVEDYIQRITK